MKIYNEPNQSKGFIITGCLKKTRSNLYICHIVHTRNNNCIKINNSLNTEKSIFLLRKNVLKKIKIYN